MAEPQPRITCQACGRSGPWRAEFAGKKIKCKCGNVMTVPATAPTVAPAPSPQSEPEDPYSLREEDAPPAKLPKLAPLAPPADPTASEPAATRFSKFAPPRATDHTAQNIEETRNLVKLIAIILVAVLVVGGAIVTMQHLSKPKPTGPSLGEDNEIQSMLDAGTPMEIHDWFKQDPARMAGPWSSNQAIHNADNWTQMGAKKVIAMGSRMTTVLVIELPADQSQRKALFAWQENWHKQHRERIWTDEGQRYLMIRLGI